MITWVKRNVRKLLVRYVKPIIVLFDRYRFKKLRQPIRVGPAEIGIMKRQIIEKWGKEHIGHLYITKQEYNNFERSYPFGGYYDKKGKRYQRKICEYFVVNKILELENKGVEYVYIDAASMGSPWGEWLYNRYGIKAKSIDIKKPEKPNVVFVQADVKKMPYKDNSINAISMQSAIELFPGTLDIDFIRESGRILKNGGVLLILPLYMNLKAYNMFGKSYLRNAEPEKESIKCIRLDYNTAFTRLYSVNSLDKRLITEAKRNDMDFKIVFIEADKDIKLSDPVDSFIYLHFCLVLTKNGNEKHNTDFRLQLK